MRAKKRYLSILIWTFLLAAVFVLFGGTKAEAASQKKLKNLLSKYSITVNVNGENQSFKIKKSEIKKLTKSKDFDNGIARPLTKTLTVSFQLDRGIAVVSAKYEFHYVWRNSKWNLQRVREISASIAQMKLKGTWEGQYISRYGNSNVSFTFDEAGSDGYLSGTKSISATDTNTNVKEATFRISGRYSVSSGTVSVQETKETTSTEAYPLDTFQMHVRLDTKELVDYSKGLAVSRIASSDTDADSDSSSSS